MPKFALKSSQMKKLLLLFFIFPLFSQSQVNDNFNDGDFSNNPTWMGNITSFNVENAELHSNGPQIASSKIFLCTANNMIDSTEWSFLFDLKFAPSSTNLVRAYLVSNDTNLINSTSAYYIEMGQTSSLNSIKFFKKALQFSRCFFYW